MALNAGQVCGTNGCFGGASDIIFKGMAGRGANLVVGFFYHQIRVAIKEIERPGGAGGPIPDSPPQINPQYYDQPQVDNNLVEVYITVRWPFQDEGKTQKFTMERKWANMIVNRINQINTFNEKFKVKYNQYKDNFVAKFRPKTPKK